MMDTHGHTFYCKLLSRIVNPVYLYIRMIKYLASLRNLKQYKPYIKSVHIRINS